MTVDYFITWMMVFMRTLGVILQLPIMTERPLPIMPRLGICVCIATLLAGIVPAAPVPIDLFALVASGSEPLRWDLPANVDRLVTTPLWGSTHGGRTRRTVRRSFEPVFTRFLAAVDEIHRSLHAQGCVRLLSYLKLETRTDKEPTLAGKRL